MQSFADHGLTEIARDVIFGMIKHVISISRLGYTKNKSGVPRGQWSPFCGSLTCHYFCPKRDIP